MRYAVIPYQTYLRPWAPASLSRCMFLACLKIMPGTQRVTEKVHRHRNTCVHGRSDEYDSNYSFATEDVDSCFTTAKFGRIWLQRTFTFLSPPQESGFRDSKGSSLFFHHQSRFTMRRGKMAVVRCI